MGGGDFDVDFIGGKGGGEVGEVGVDFYVEISI